MFIILMGNQEVKIQGTHDSRDKTYKMTEKTTSAVTKSPKMCVYLMQTCKFI